MSWFNAFGALPIRVCQAQRSHLASVLDCKLIGLTVHAANATAYVGNGVPFPVAG